MIRMNHGHENLLGRCVVVRDAGSRSQADDFKLSNNQRLSCSRGLSAGKLNTATCKSYAYLQHQDHGNISDARSAWR